LVLNTSNGNRVAFLPADLDRRFGRDNLPDHGNLLANLVSWTAGNDLPLHIEGAGLIDCHLYRQRDCVILHVVNMTNPGAWRAPIDELIPIGPLRVAIKLLQGVRGRRVKLLVAGQRIAATTRDGWSRFELKSVLDHEVVVVG
jgi:hypothetical protein